jgi:hypothetical protein
MTGDSLQLQRLHTVSVTAFTGIPAGEGRFTISWLKETYNSVHSF